MPGDGLSTPSLSAVDRKFLSSSLIDFVRHAWAISYPSKPFQGGRHIEVICQLLERVTKREVRNLIINIPPRHSKSSIVSVLWPAWVWTHSPQVQWLHSSYAASLSTRDSLACRRLLQSDWYRARWGHLFDLTGDQNAKMRFDNTAAGYRLSTSTHGLGTGEGGDVIVIDDPHNAEEALSDVERARTTEWWDSTMSSRLNDPKTGCRVLVMQRLHEDDLTGHLLAKKGWYHLCLPVRFEKGHPYRSKLDWRTEEGELLAPDRFGEKEVADLTRNMSSMAVAGQLQQRPAPEGGNIFRRSWFKIWPAKRPLPQFEFMLSSYDTAFTDQTENDQTACITLGVFKPDEDKQLACMVLDCWAEHIGYPDLRRRMIEDFKSSFGEPARYPDMLLIEDKGSGIALRQDLRRAGIPLTPYNPGKASKIARAHLVTHIVERGAVYLPESSIHEGRPRDWCEPLLGQLMLFPSGKHDDFVDALTQALRYLRDGTWLVTDKREEPEYSEPPVYTNPYAV